MSATVSLAPSLTAKQLVAATKKAARAEGTQINYHRANCHFLAYLAQTHPEDLSPALVALAGDQILSSVVVNEVLSTEDGSSIFPLSPSFTIDHFEEFLATRMTKKGKPLDASSLGTFRSALRSLHEQHKVPFDQAITLSLSAYFKGAKRETAKRKQNGEGRVEEGKDPLPFSVYRELNKALIINGSSRAIFTLAFGTLSWNLTCRASNTKNIRALHMKVCDDAIGIHFAHQKNDQEGNRPKDPRHVYANPVMPEISVFLALGLYFLTHGFSSADGTNKEDGSLFPGSSQYQRYSADLKCVFHPRFRECLCNFQVGPQPAHGDKYTQFLGH